MEISLIDWLPATSSTGEMTRSVRSLFPTLLGPLRGTAIPNEDTLAWIAIDAIPQSRKPEMSGIVAAGGCLKSDTFDHARFFPTQTHKASAAFVGESQ